MLVVFSVAPPEIDRATDLLQWIHELGGCPGHRLLVFTARTVRIEETTGLSSLASGAFDDVGAIRQGIADERPWPLNANSMFRAAVNAVAAVHQGPWLWLEMDAIPMRPGWLDAIEQEYAKAGKPFMGAFYEQPRPHINGVMVYPQNVRGLAPATCIASSLPFDLTKPEVILARAHRTGLIVRSLADPRTNTPHSFPDADSLRIIPESCVLFHGCKDGSLIARLREQKGVIPVGHRPAAVEPAGGRASGIPEAKREEDVKIPPRPAIVPGKASLDAVTLVCVDTQRPDRAAIGVDACTKHFNFANVLFFIPEWQPGTEIVIPRVNGLAGYSKFLMQQVPKYVKSSHALICQWDGYILNPAAWSDEFLKYDYIGAVSDMGDGRKRVGNGGFSLRSKRLMDACALLPEPHSPEDQIICIRHRATLERRGFRFAPESLARQFSAEMEEWKGQFGFHSFRTKLPRTMARPTVFHHSGDWGDIIYALPAIEHHGAGVLFISKNTCAPKMPTRQEATPATVRMIAPLLEQQEYVWQCRYTPELPVGVDYDFNQFRMEYKSNTNSLMAKQLAVANAEYSEQTPWLTVDGALSMRGRPLVLHRCPRKLQYNRTFPWKQIVERFGRYAIFVGTKDEHESLVENCGYVPFVSTGDFLELARVIAGASLFIGSNSAPMAIAIGLGKPFIQEVLTVDDNCRFNRSNSNYVSEGQTLDEDLIRYYL